MWGKKKLYSTLVLLFILISTLVNTTATAQSAITSRNITKTELSHLLNSALQLLVENHAVINEVTPEIKLATINNISNMADPCHCLLSKGEAQALENASMDEATKIYDSLTVGNFDEVLQVLSIVVGRLDFIKENATKLSDSPKGINSFVDYVNALLKNDNTVEVSFAGKKISIKDLFKKISEERAKNKNEFEDTLTFIFATHGVKLKEIKKDISNKELYMEAVNSFVETYDNNILEVPPGNFVLNAIIASFAESLDPHSAFFSLFDYALFSQSITYYEPIGIDFITNTKGPLITEVFENTVASNSKIEKGDFIIEVDGQNIADLDGQEASLAFRAIASKNPISELLVLRNGNKVRVTLNRNISNKENSLIQPDVTFSTNNMGTKKIGVLKIRSFSIGSAEIVRKVLKENLNTDGLIIDLRYNGGGSLDDVTKIAYLFQDSDQSSVWSAGSIKHSDGFSTNVDNINEAGDWGQIYNKPLLVLINNASASASEILAGTLKVHGKALVAGSEHTYGKGSVQVTMPVAHNNNYPLGIAKLTTQLYFLADGSSPQFIGVNSQISIKGSFDKEEGREKSLKNAIKPTTLEYNPLETSFYPKTLSTDLESLKSKSQERQATWEKIEAGEKNEDRIIGEAQNILFDWINSNTESSDQLLVKK